MNPIRTYFGFQFFFSLLLWAPVFYEFHRRMGLSDTDVFAIQSIYYLAFCLFEIPTGLLADRIGYRRCMTAGAALLVAANVMPVAWSSYYGFVVHWLCIAMSRSLISGASSAWLYEHLRQHGEPADFKGIEGRARALSLLGKVVGWSGIGYLMEWHLTLPYWLTALSAAVAVRFALALPNVQGTPSREPRAGTLPWSRFLILIMVQGVAIFVLARICQVNLFQPILNSKGWGLGAAGVVMALTTLFEAAGSAWPEVLRRRVSDLHAVFLLTVAMAVTLVGMAWSGPIGTVVWLSLFALCVGLSYPIQRQLVNDAICDPSWRATVMSVESLLDRAVCALVAAQLGSFVAAGAVNTLLYLAAAVSTVLMALLWWRAHAVNRVE